VLEQTDIEAATAGGWQRAATFETSQVPSGFRTILPKPIPFETSSALCPGCNALSIARRSAVISRASSSRYPEPIFALLCGSVFGQINNATVYGTVKDPTGAAVI